MTSPQITTVLRTADDWAPWLQQVRAYILTLGWKDYMTPEAGFQPPPPPPRPPMDGMGGSQNLLEWTYDRERARHAACEEEYDDFVGAVKRSIHPALAVDLSDRRGFRDLFADLKGLLRIDTLVEKPKLEGVWRILMAQSLGEIPMKEWGNKVVEALRFLREVGSSVAVGWEPYLDFIDNINKHYPVVAPAIYFRLYDMQRRLEKQKREKPQGHIFEEFVAINVAMISRLAERSTQDRGSSRSTTMDATFGPSLRTSQDHERPRAASAIAGRRDDEDQTQDAARSTLKNTTRENINTGATVNNETNSREECRASLGGPTGKSAGELKELLMAKTLERKAQRQEQQKIPPAAEAPTRERHQPHDKPPMTTGQVSGEHRQGKAGVDAPKLGDQHPQNLFPMTSGQETTDQQNQQGMLRPIPTLRTDEHRQGNRAVRQRKLERQQHVDPAPMTAKQEGASQNMQQDISFKKAASVGHTQGNGTHTSLNLENQHGLRDALATTSTQEGTSRDKQQGTHRPAADQVPGGHDQRNAEPTDLKLENRVRNPLDVRQTALKHEPTSQQEPQKTARRGTPYPKRCGEDGYTEKPAPMTLGEHQIRDSLPAGPKRKNEEEHEKRPMAPEGPGAGAERRWADTARDDLLCYVCFNWNHRTSACWLLARYSKYREDAPRLSRAAMERCRAWLRGGEADVGGLEEAATQSYCRVCLRLGHDTEWCKQLTMYRRFGDGTRGMKNAVKARCAEVLREEDAYSGLRAAF